MTNTPLPWNLYFDHPDDATRPQVGYIDGADRHSYGTTEIATVFSCAADPRQKANAELIVRAVNAHEALLGELVDVLNWLKEISRLDADHDIDIPMETVPFMRSIEKAIAKAKEPSC